VICMLKDVGFFFFGWLGMFAAMEGFVDNLCS
jgi:hypothetical protein